MHTIKQLLTEIAKKFNESGLFFGHGTISAEDEAYSLIYMVLDLPFTDEEDCLEPMVTSEEEQKIMNYVERRIKERKPLPYLLQQAYFGGLSFYVDENVLIPRTPIAELIENQFSPWIKLDQVKSILDLGTGSGCIAVLCAKHFPQAKIDGVDLSKAALNVAKINVEKHQVQKQVKLIHSDLFDQLPLKQYDIIVSNPPYVDESEMKTLPEEYAHEPEFALKANDEGLEIVIRILKNAAKYLSDHGILIVEVGNTQEALEARFPRMPFIWLEFERGGQGVFLLTKQDLISAEF